jgi:hypothetical protein
MSSSCPDSTAGLVTGISAVVVLIISEILPFFPNIPGNGLLHALITTLRTQLPLATPATPSTSVNFSPVPESPIPPPATV